MSEYVICGGKKLEGEIVVEGSKNAVLPIMSACLLVRGVSILHNVPEIRDVQVTIDILKSLGCKVTQFYERKGEHACRALIIDASVLQTDTVPETLASCLRSSVTLLGALLGRTGSARGSLPGGCRLGNRPIDFHLKAFEELGYELEQVTQWDIRITRGKACYSFQNVEISLPYPSVGATENIILASIGCRGETIIHNAAREPELIELQEFLVRAGFHVCGAGTTTVTIKGLMNGRMNLCIPVFPCERTSGKQELSYEICPDRIVGATYMCAAAINKGCLKIVNAIPEHVCHVSHLLRKCGCDIEVQRRGEVSGISCGETNMSMRCNLTVRAPNQLSSDGLTIETAPYPGFASDMQPLATVLLVASNGNGLVHENVFSNRFEYVHMLKKMGADIILNKSIAMVRGGASLKGAHVEATDLRGGAAIVLAATMAEDKSVVSKIEYIDRGYESFAEKLRSLGANIECAP